MVFSADDVVVWGESDVLATVRDLTLTDDGTVWVLNSGEPFLVGFGPDGTPLEPYGAEGGGPDEFGLPVGFVEGGIDGRPWVFDARRHLLVQVAGPDAPRAELPIPDDVVPQGSIAPGGDLLDPTVRPVRLGGEVVLPRSDAAFEPGQLVAYRLAILGADLVAFDPDGGEVRTVATLRTLVDDPAGDFEAVEGGFPLWFRLWAACGGGELAVYDRGAHLIRTVGPDGTPGASVELPPPPFDEVTPVQFAKAVFPLRVAEVTGGVGRPLTGPDSARLIDEMAGGLTASPAQLGAYLPRYVDLRCDDDGRLWLRPLDLDAGALQGARSWIVLDREGGWSEVVLPERFDPLRFEGGRVWGVQRDRFDVAAVAWIALDRDGA